MKKLLLCALAIVIIAPSALADSIQMSSGALTNVVVATGTGTTNFSGVFGGWTVSAVGTSNSPGVSPFGLDLLVAASCSSGDCLTNPLNIFLSAINFNVPVAVGGFQTSYSATVTGIGNTSEIAWANGNNTLFSLGGANKIGATLGPFSSPNGSGSTSGGPAESGLYSQTIEQIFNANGGASSFTNADAKIIVTPEPASWALCGIGLLTLILFRSWKMRNA